MLIIPLSQFELIERNTQTNSYLLVIVLMCFAFIGIARVAQPDIITHTLAGFFKMKRVENPGFESSKMLPSLNALIILNYLFSFSTCLFLLLNPLFDLQKAIWIALIIVGTISVLHVLNFRLVAVLTGESMIIEAMGTINKQVWSFGGFLFIALALIWILNQEYQLYFEKVFIVIYFIIFTWRISKGFRLSLQLRYKWYYLILYLCTLEILPILIFSKIAWLNFLN